MKKRKVNPSSNVAKVLDLMKADAKVSVKEIVEKTNLKTSNVYAIRNYIKKNGLLKTLPMTGIAPKAKVIEVRGRKFTFSKRDNTSNIKKKIAPVDTSFTYTKNLEKENKQLTEWTQMWKHRCDKLEHDCTQAKVMYLDQLAVVRYLEAKLLQLVEAKIKERDGT